MHCYFDSSALVKRYALEKGSETVRAVFEADDENTVYMGQIGVVEIAAALSKKVRMKELSQDDYQSALLLLIKYCANQRKARDFRISIRMKCSDLKKVSCFVCFNQ